MHKQPAWGGSKLFITGATGFLGKAILKKLRGPVEAGEIASITILSRNPDEFLRRYPEFSWLANASFIHGNILTCTFPDEKYTHVIHAATDTNDQTLTNPLQFLDEIVTGTRRALDFAVASGAKRFLLTSSGAVYGPQPADLEVIPETYLGAPSTVDPKSVYGQAKRSAEHLCRIYCDQSGIDCTIARCFSCVGDYMPFNGQYAIGNFIRDALSVDTDQITVQGDGTPVRSYLHMDDMADWLLRILQQGKPCHPYNVGSDEAINMADLASLVRDLLAPGKTVVIAKERTDYAGRSRYVPSVERIRQELGARISLSLGDAIGATAAAIKLSGRGLN